MISACLAALAIGSLWPTLDGSTVRASAQRPGPSTPESLLVVSAAEHALTVHDPLTGNRRAYFRVGIAPSSVAVSSDGRTAVVTNRGSQLSGNSICVIDLYASNIVRTIELTVSDQRPNGDVVEREYHRPSGAIFLPDRPRVLVTCATEGALLLVDLINARVVADVLLDEIDAEGVVLDHTGRYAFVSHRSSGTVSVVSVDGMRVVETIDAGGQPSGMALHPDKNEVWVANRTTNSISIIDADALRERTEVPSGAMPVDLDFTPDGRNALVLNHQEGNVSVIDTESLRVRTVITLNRVTPQQAQDRPVDQPAAFGRSPLPTRITVDPMGERAWVATARDDRITEVDLKRWRLRRSIDTLREPICVELSQPKEPLAKSR
ncbi:MAG: YncE family protein [Planctomycetota bacterium]